jgi:hypothetical protein
VLSPPIQRYNTSTGPIVGWQPVRTKLVKVLHRSAAFGVRKATWSQEVESDFNNRIVSGWLNPKVLTVMTLTQGSEGPAGLWFPTWSPSSTCFNAVVRRRHMWSPAWYTCLITCDALRATAAGH